MCSVSNKSIWECRWSLWIRTDPTISLNYSNLIFWSGHRSSYCCYRHHFRWWQKRRWLGFHWPPGAHNRSYHSLGSGWRLVLRSLAIFEWSSFLWPSCGWLGLDVYLFLVVNLHRRARYAVFNSVHRLQELGRKGPVSRYVAILFPGPCQSP